MRTTFAFSNSSKSSANGKMSDLRDLKNLQPNSRTFISRSVKDEEMRQVLAIKIKISLTLG